MSALALALALPYQCYIFIIHSISSSIQLRTCLHRHGSEKKKKKREEEKKKERPDGTVTQGADYTGWDGMRGYRKKPEFE